MQSQFAIRIKNIGLGSLVDFEIKKVSYKDTDEVVKDLDFVFNGNFILGKEETIRMVVHLRVDFESADGSKIKELEEIKILVRFKDLLGHSYNQQFTIESDSHSLGRGEIERPDKSHKTGNTYSIEPIKIEHSHPFEQ